MTNLSHATAVCTGCLKQLNRPATAVKKFIDSTFYRQGQGDPEVHDRFCSHDCFLNYQCKKYDENERRTKYLQRARYAKTGKTIKAERASLRTPPVVNQARLRQKEKRRASKQQVTA